MTAYALRKLQSFGHRIFICTGRTLCDIYPEITDIGFDGIISGVGANVMIGGKSVFHRLVPRELLVRTVRGMLACQLTAVLEGTRELYIVDGRVPFFWPAVAIHIQHLEQLQKVENIEKMTFHIENRAQIKKILPFLNQNYHLYYSPDGTMVEAALKGNDKGKAIDRVLRYFHASMRDAVAFGDSSNDCAMFLHVRTGVSMGNAPQALRNIATMSTGTIRQEGVYRALEALHFLEDPPN